MTRVHHFCFWRRARKQQRRTNVRKSTIYLFVLGLAVVTMAALASAGLVVSAQNTNSSTTMAPTNTAAKKKPRRHKVAAATTGPCDPTKQEQTDLSGTYTGKVNYPDAGLTGDATLTITGNNFTLTAGSATQSGRVTAVTTCGYTGVTMMFGDLTPATPSPNPPSALPAVSLRARKVGDRVTLMTVPGEKRSFSFGSVGAAKAPRKHKAKAKAKPDTPTMGSNPGTPPPPPTKPKQ
jgi:hypothetical protein